MKTKNKEKVKKGKGKKKKTNELLYILLKEYITFLGYLCLYVCLGLLKENNKKIRKRKCFVIPAITGFTNYENI